MASTGGWSNWEMVLIESRRFGTRLEAKQLERFHYEQLNREFALNMIFPCRDAAEYYENNKDAFVVKNKNYREANKDAIAAYKKDYNEANKDAIAAYKRDYNEANKDAIDARCNVKHNCICGGRYTTQNLSTHMKTKKHTAYIAQIKK